MPRRTSNIHFARHYKPREYTILLSIRQRCKDPRSQAYPRYGGKGISYPNSWDGLVGYAAFIADVGEAPSPEHSLMRRNKSMSYFKENCYWASRAERGRTHPRKRLITAFGVTMRLVDWARRLGCSPSVISHRLDHCWTPEDAVSLPVQKGFCRHPYDENTADEKPSALS